jgi:hypothetical protein
MGARRCHEATHVGRVKCKGPMLSAGFDGSSAVNEPHKPTEGSLGCGGGEIRKIGLWGFQHSPLPSPAAVVKHQALIGLAVADKR